MNRTVKHYFPIFVLPTLIAFIIAFAVPVVMGLVLSFTELRTVADATFVGFSNYVRAFTDDKLLWLLLNGSRPDLYKNHR